MGDAVSFQFINEEGAAARRGAKSNLSVIRSHVTKHNALKRQHRNAPSKQALGALRNILKKDPDVLLEDITHKVSFKTGDCHFSVSASIPAHPSQINSRRKPPQTPHARDSEAQQSLPSAEDLETLVSKRKENRYHLTAAPICGDAQFFDFQWRSDSPRMILGAGRIDPFDVYPVNAELYVHHLVDYYASVCCFTFPQQRDTGLSTLHTRWMPLCMKNEMAFKSMIFVAEVSGRSTRGLESWSLRAIKLSLEAISLLNKEIDLNGGVSDLMIATVINIAVIELIYGDNKKYQSHMRGLRDMVKLRGGLENLDSEGFMKGMIVWIHQLGGEFLLPKSEGALDGNTPRTERIHENQPPSLSSTSDMSSISSELVHILITIRLLGIQQNTHENNPHNTTENFEGGCKAVLQRLESLELKTTFGTLEESCLHAAFMYIHMIYLQTPYIVLAKCKSKNKLQEALSLPRSERDLNENMDVIKWIVSTAALAVGGQGYDNQRVRLVGRFNILMERLEALYIL